MFRPSRSIVRWAAAPFIAGAALAVLLLPARGEAQTCPLGLGCRATTQQTIPFAATEQSLWGPADADEVPNTHTIPIFDDRWSAGDTTKSFESFSWVGGKEWFGGEIGGVTSGRFGARMLLEGFSESTVDIDYPVTVTISWPEPNTFRPGDDVTIETSWTPGDLSMDTKYEAIDIDLRAVFGMRHAAHYELCFFDCTGDVALFPTLDFPETDFSIFHTLDGGYALGTDPITDVASGGSALVAFLTGVSGRMDDPEPFSGITVDGTRLSASGSDEYLTLDIDIDTFLRFFHVLPGFPYPPFGAKVPLANYGAFDLEYETIDLDMALRLSQEEDIEFDAGVNIRVDFPTALGYHVENPSGSVTGSGTAASITFPAGHSLTIYTPASVDPMDLRATFSIENTFKRNSNMRFFSGFTNRELLLSLKMAEKKFSKKTGRDWFWDERWVDCDDLDDLGDVYDCFVGAISGFWEDFKHYFDVITPFTANALNFSVGPAYETEFAETEFSVPIFEDSWELGGFADASGPTMLLDPENPIIAVSSSWEYMFPTAFTQTMVVENLGDVPLNATSVMDALDVAGLSVANIQSFDIRPNTGFDGLGDAESLVSGQTIPIGGSTTITIRWKPTPGTYSAAISAQGTSPIGTVVTADGGTMRFGWLAMDIQPDSLNRKSRGQLPVHLYGTPGFAVGDIDQSSLALEGIAPNKVQVEDLNLDGIPDLKLRFDRPAVIAGMDTRIAALAPVVAAAEMATTLVFGVQAPEFTADQVAGALLRGGAGFTQDDIFAMDRAGNGNGRLDVGDLRAAVLGGGTVLAMAKGGNGKGNAGGNNSGKTDDGGLGEGAPPEDFIFVLTGNMTDSTPFWAEDHAVVQGDAR